MGDKNNKTAEHVSEYEQPVSFTNTDLEDVIELRNVSQTYPGLDRWVIEGFNLLIEKKPKQGQFVVILGTSGCGKSTILRYICGLQKPTSGKVLIGGKEPVKSDPISMVFQQYSSFPWYTVLQNVMLPLDYHGVNKKEARDRAMEMIKKVGLEGHEGKFAQYPTLSGGQLQRVAIARSLVSNPRILLMDEPFGALDIHTRSSMQVFLAKLWMTIEPTIILVTHDIREAVFLGDDIYVMDANPGQIVKSFHVDLPFDRDRETKKDPRFNQQVEEIEDFLYQLGQQKVK